MLWAKRFQIEHANLLTRVKAAEELAARVTSLEEETKDLAAGSNNLREQNILLRDRVRLLEEDVTTRESAYGEHAEKLKAKVTSLENTLSLLTKSQKRWKEGIDAKCDQAGIELRGIKARIEASRAFVSEVLPNRHCKCQILYYDRET